MPWHLARTHYRDMSATQRDRRTHSDLLALVRDKVHAERELVHAGLLESDVKNLDLGLGHTTEVARPNVRLVLAVAVAASLWKRSTGETKRGREREMGWE